MKFIIIKTKKNKYLFFLIKLLLLFAVVFIFDAAIGAVLKHYYFKQESGLQYRTTYSIEKTKADLLVFGASRANHHYHPKVFEKGLKMSYYNVGRDGSSIMYHKGVLNAVLKRYTPKIIILDFVIEEFMKIDGNYDRLSSLLPYYQTHPEMRLIIELKSKYEKYKLISSIYPYNSSLFTIAMGNTESNKKRKGDINGYVPLTKVWNDSIIVDNRTGNYELDSTKIKVYESFIQDCIHSQVKLYIVFSPHYIKFRHADSSILIAKEIAQKYHVAFIDFSKDAFFLKSHQLFQDIDHLNDDGAKIFSNLMIDKMIQSRN